MPRKVFYAALALVMLLSLSACTVFQWGGTTGKAAPQPEKQADEVFKEGEELLAKGKYEAARQKFSRAGDVVITIIDPYGRSGGPAICLGAV